MVIGGGDDDDDDCDDDGGGGGGGCGDVCSYVVIKSILNRLIEWPLSMRGFLFACA